jgi:WD40 repeat protein/tRNA A-37 threonylcarbamoyl transferase component Bud32
MSGPAAPADRNLLFGILALQMNFISCAALIEAMNAWVQDKQKPLGQILVEHKALAADTYQLVDTLVQKHLELHGGDVQKSLTAIRSVASFQKALEQITDPEIRTSLASTFHDGADPFATRASVTAAQTCPGMRFRVLRRHARGGLGEVFVARDEEVPREVALKEIQCHADSPETRARFLQEAEITGGLEHPGIVPVYGLGQYADGRPYYAMRFIKGDSLRDAIDRFHRDQGKARAKRLELRELLARFIDVCNAIAYAHSRGVLHRDLKPGNVMLGKYGETLVVDWGLAKPLGQNEAVPADGEQPLVLSRDSGSVKTAAGSAMGTPQFMSPEQAAGQLDQLGLASDVYSLGGTLYCLLTGQPPFADTDIGTLLKKVQCGAFLPPRQVKRTVPPALEAICLKAMALKPEDRYSSPEALADDIKHWLADEPVAVYREPWTGRLWRWARRHHTGVTAVAAALLALFGASLWYQGHLAAALTQSRRLQKEAEDAHAAASRRLVRLRVASGTQLVNDGDLLGSLPWFAQVLQLEHDNPERAAMNRIRLGTVLQQCPKFSQLWFHNGRVLWATFSPDGRRAVTCGTDDKARIWDVASGQPIGVPLVHGENVVFVTFNADGTRVATASADGTAGVWDAASGQPLTGALRHDGRVFSARFNVAGDRLLTAGEDATARLWDTTTGKETLRLKHAGPVNDAGWSHDGSRLVTASADHTARIWNAVSGQPVGEALRHKGAVQAAVFDARGNQVATASTDYTARVWDAATGKPLTEPLEHHGPVHRAVFSPDSEGHWLVTASADNKARIWDGRRGYGLHATLRHGSDVYDARFSPDGKLLATASDDNTARVWELATGDPHETPLKHVATVYRVTFSPDSKQVLTACADGSARIWHIDAVGAPEMALLHDTEVTSASFHPHGQYVLTADAGGTAAVWEVASGKRLEPVMKHSKRVHRAIYSADGRRILTASADHTARVWDAATRRPLGPPLEHRQDVPQAEFSPDGQRVVTASADRTARIWDPLSGRVLCEFAGHNGPVNWVIFSPDGKCVATAGGDKNAQLRDAASGALLFPPLQHQENVEHVAFSADGRYLVTASDDRTAQVWDAQTGKRIGQPMRHADKVYKAQFSPDSQGVVTSSGDNTARIWDAATGKPLTPPLRHSGTVNRAQFSPDGRHVVTASDDATARVWDSVTGQPLTPPLRHRLPVANAYFSPRGARVVTASNDKTARIWHLAPDERPVADLVLIATLLAGGRIDDTGGFLPLQPRELEQAWEKARPLFRR